MANSVLKASICLLPAAGVFGCTQLGVGPRGTMHGAGSGRDCPAQSFSAGRLTASQTWVAAQQKCIVMVSADTGRRKSRSYVFNSHGMLLVFHVFGSGRVSRTTGARTHFLLPNVQPLRLQKTRRRVLVHTSSGHTVSFDPASGHPEGISGGVFRVSRQITARKGGGVTLRTRSGIVVDFGFMRGESPHLEPNRRATLTDAKGRRCRVKNKDLFSYDRDEPRLRFASANHLSRFLKSERAAAAKCAPLTLAAVAN